MPVKKKVRTEYTEEQLKQLSREDLIDLLNDNEIAFCEYYIRDYNIKLAAIKAGYAPKSANVQGIRLRNKKEVNNYIAWLKLKAYQKANVDALDILNFYAKAAFSDIGDYVEVTNNGRRLKVKSIDETDGQLIQEVSMNPQGGISLKLVNKIDALKRLEFYMDTNPYDWQRKIEERKVQIMEDKLALEKLKFDPNETEQEDDGFIDALVKAADGIFDDEPDDEIEDTEE
jgi:phage terminase small subunit